MGEGAGIVIIEELERARRRGANVLAEVSGYGMSGDAHHVTAPSPDGDGARRAMEAALASAGLAPSSIDYVNAHGTSTPAGDEIEISAMKAAFGGNVTGLAVLLHKVLHRAPARCRRGGGGSVLRTRHP